MKERITTCPYCGSERIEETAEDGLYFCRSCKVWFNETDVEWEDIRHDVAHLLMETDKDSPMACDIVVGESDAQGLSSLELPRIDKCFQMPLEGTLWFHIKGTPEDDWKDFDSFVIEDLRSILMGLQATL